MKKILKYFIILLSIILIVDYSILYIYKEINGVGFYDFYCDFYGNIEKCNFLLKLFFSTLGFFLLYITTLLTLFLFGLYGIIRYKKIKVFPLYVYIIVFIVSIILLSLTFLRHI